jgi:hypothetical protein
MKESSLDSIPLALAQFGKIRGRKVIMIGDSPIISFDTSTHNELVKDGPRAEIMLAGLKSGLSFRFVGLSIDEMVATANPTKRAALFAYVPASKTG